ncbi:uncharacterized protein LOC129725912 [Wyeomyia smithii]|uniref:uncharacterized protein LOC129725912 n=1 Tax=Wyeomyia smithii TaxID=174621 RepID=UPI0024681B68|nr:uncharacterized protein LOC129725912 [Wyeomyia smithii]
MMNRNNSKTSCPRTPAPLRNTSFLMSAAAILETPTLLKKSSTVSSSSEISVTTSGHEFNPPSAASSAAMQFLMLNQQFQVATNNATPYRPRGELQQSNFAANSSYFNMPSPFVPPSSTTMEPNSVRTMQTISNAEGSFKRKSTEAHTNKPAKRVAFEPLPLNPNSKQWQNRNLPAITYGSSSKQAVKAPNEAAKKDPKQLRLITGSIEYIIKMTKLLPDYGSALLEIYANVLSIKEGTYQSEKVLLLRNRTGPVMQGVFYEIDFRMTAIATGDLVRCVGRLNGGSRLQILKITPASVEDEQMGARLQTVSGFAATVKR